MENTRKKYSEDFKLCVVAMSYKYGSIPIIALEIGISRHNLQHWKKSFKDGKLTLEKTSDTDTKSNELSRLQKENKDIKIKLDILKKALGIFSERDGQHINLSKKMLRYFPSGRCAKFLM